MTYDYDVHGCTSVADAGCRGATDGAGNQIQKIKAGVTTHFVYDARNNLREVTTGGSTVGQFLYDYQGLRTEKQGERGTERYSHDDQAVLFQTDETATVQARYQYGPNRLLSLKQPDLPTEFYLFDALRSPVTLVRKDGSITARYAYDAWGEKRHESGDSFNRFGFTGHEHDEETGLIYAKARYYDPEVARFLSQDPAEMQPDMPPSLHKYLYAYQNPTIYLDPDGRFPVLEGMVDELARWREDTVNTAAGLENNGVNTFTAAGMGMGAGLLGALEFGVGIINTGADLAVDNIADENSDSFLVQESRRSLGETREAFTRGIEMVAEDPSGVGTRMLEASGQALKGFAEGDTEATARVFQTGFEAAAGGRVGVPAARQAGNTARLAGETAEKAVRTATRKAKDAGRALRQRARGPSKAQGFSFDAFDFDVRSTFTNGRFREIVVKEGNEFDRAFQKGVNNPKSPFLTRGNTARRLSTTEESRRILAIEGTSDVFPDTVTRLRADRPARALIGPIKDGDGFQVIVDPNDLSNIVEIPGARRALPPTE